MFIGQTGCGKTHLLLELIENQNYKHFDYIVIIFQHFEKIMKPIMPGSGSKMVIKFGF